MHLLLLQMVPAPVTEQIRLALPETSVVLCLKSQLEPSSFSEHVLVLKKFKFSGSHDYPIFLHFFCSVAYKNVSFNSFPNNSPYASLERMLGISLFSKHPLFHTIQCMSLVHRMLALWIRIFSRLNRVSLNISMKKVS